MTESIGGRGAAMRWSNPMALVGGAPWRVLPECQAAHAHNTLRVARALKPCGQEKTPKCICPHARDLLAAFRLKEQERKRGSSTAGTMNYSNARYMNNVRTELLPPDLSDGACRTVLGRRMTDEVLNGRNGAVPAFKAKLCFGGPRGTACSALERCRAWVLRDESPAGDWKGVYGGLSIQERVRLAG